MTRAIFRSCGTTPGAPDYPERSGQTVEIVRPLDPGQYDADEVGPMYVARFEDGTEAEVFADELIPA